MKVIRPEQRLANAIIVQAVKDYRTALAGHSIERHKPKKVISDVERFFRSDWYYFLTDVDGERLMKEVREELGL